MDNFHRSFNIYFYPVLLSSFLINILIYSQFEYSLKYNLLILGFILSFFLIFIFLNIQKYNINSKLFSWIMIAFFSFFFFTYWRYQYENTLIKQQLPMISHLNEENQKESLRIKGIIADEKFPSGFKREKYQFGLKIISIEIKIPLSNKQNYNQYQKQYNLIYHQSNHLQTHYILLESLVGFEHLLTDHKHTIYTSTTFFNPTQSVNNGGYQNYLIRNRILGKIRLFNTNQIFTFKTNQISIKINEINTMVHHTHEYVYNKIIRYIEPNNANLAFAMLSGNKIKLHPIIKKSFQDVGISHILAVSGMHAGIIVFFFYSIFRLLRMRRKIAMSIIIFLVMPFYLIFTHLPVSIIRTYIMLVLAFILFLMDRKINLLSLFTIVFLMTIFINPSYIFDLSFQLSFSAVFGIFVAIDLLKLFKMRNFFIQYTFVSLGAQLFTLPFVIYYFGYVNWFSLFYNLIISYSMTLVYIFSLILTFSPFDYYNRLIGNTIDILSEVSYLFLNKTKFNIDLFHWQFLKGNDFFAIGLSIFILMLFIIIIQVNKKPDSV